MFDLQYVIINTPIDQPPVSPLELPIHVCDYYPEFPPSYDDMTIHIIHKFSIMRRRKTYDRGITQYWMNIKDLNLRHNLDLLSLWTFPPTGNNFQLYSIQALPQQDFQSQQMYLVEFTRVGEGRTEQLLMELPFEYFINPPQTYKGIT